MRVREAAATLLARIADGAYAGRAAARADTILVRYEPPAGGLRGVAAGLSRRGLAGRLAVEPPEHPDAGWRRDLPGDMPERGVGENGVENLPGAFCGDARALGGTFRRDAFGSDRRRTRRLGDGVARGVVSGERVAPGVELGGAALAGVLPTRTRSRRLADLADCAVYGRSTAAVGPRVSHRTVAEERRDALSTFFYSAGDLRPVATGPVRGFSRRPAQAHKRHLPSTGRRKGKSRG